MLYFFSTKAYLKLKNTVKFFQNLKIIILLQCKKSGSICVDCNHVKKSAKTYSDFYSPAIAAYFLRDQILTILI